MFANLRRQRYGLPWSKGLWFLGNRDHDHPVPASGEWIIGGVDAGAGRSFLQRYAPWRMELKFESGPKASDGAVFQPFNPAPLSKLRVIMNHMPDAFRRGVRALDVGFNAGYNSIFLAQSYDASVVGIDIAPKHKLVATELSGMLGVRAEFILASAEEFEQKNAFDLILHLGTLYHLANPVRSLERSFRSLRSGGWFALETICYRASSDPAACKWINGFGGDKTNFWALGEGAIESIARYSGLPELRLILEVWPEVYQKEMSRCIWIGRKH